jgi:hypothetical protein
MFIHDPPRDQTRKELKVNLPARQHRHLRALQVDTGREAPVLVAEALGMYFAKLAEKKRRDERT